MVLASTRSIFISSGRFNLGIRFAPSPTGRFHLGNLRTAWISWKLAKETKLPWVVRFEDIDAPRVVHGAQQKQLDDMAVLGMKPDQVLIQSQSIETHQLLFEQAMAAGVVYPCVCSRKQIAQALAGMQSAPHGIDFEYPGTCQGRPLKEVLGEAATLGRAIGFRFGHGHFLVGRAHVDENARVAKGSFQPSYQWACALDDFFGMYAAIVRGCDLIPALGPQRAIQTWLLSTGKSGKIPSAIHTRMVVDRGGTRLEKRTQGVTLSDCAMSANQILNFFETSLPPGWIKKVAEALTQAKEPIQQNESDEVLRLS